MSTTLTTTFSAPVANYPSLQDAVDDLGVIYGSNVQALVSSARAAVDMELDPVSQVEELGGNYIITETTVWVDQLTAEEYIADPSIASELAAAEVAFTVERVFS